MLGNKSTWCNLFNILRIMKTSNKAPRFFIKQKISDSDQLVISNENSEEKIIHQIKNVLRKKEGDKIIFLDGMGSEFIGIIYDISKNEITLKKREINFYKKEFFENENQKIILAPAILKKDNFEFVLQKCTEIGVRYFQPIISERTEKNNLNFERSEKILKEASEQSEKKFLPKLSETKTLQEFLQRSTSKNIFALEFNSENFRISDFEKKDGDIIFLVGPEGGWGEEDKKLFDEFSVKTISLGSQILRAETASISLSSLLFLNK